MVSKFGMDTLLAILLITISLENLASGSANWTPDPFYWRLGLGGHSARRSASCDEWSLAQQRLDARAGNDSKPDRRTRVYRLPETVQPMLYKLRLCPKLEGDFDFNGVVEIDVHANKATSQLLLHAHLLRVHSVEVWQDGKPVQADYRLQTADQLLNVTTRRKLRGGRNSQMKIQFSGQLNDVGNGFFRSSYTLANSTKWLAATQFESTFARWAFPCFDEPRFRTPFIISLARYPNQTALSNMPRLNTSQPDSSINNRVWDTFATTPPMPTYLAAFVIGELKNFTDSDGMVKLWATENVIQQAKYGQMQTLSSLRNMEKLIGIPYQLPKMDIVAVPDFRSGAMENWGLILAKEKYTLLNHKNASELNKFLVTSVIAHEMAHQWFGDLVTISWWSHLWLKEGFATYFEYFLTNVMEPTWKIGQLFNFEVVQYALSTDGIFSHVSMTSTEEIASTVDDISYKKAGSVIRMVEHLVSTPTFYKTLTSYLKLRKEGGGVSEPFHLYESFDEEMKKEGKSLPNNLTVSAIFKKFANQIGYPCITIARQQKGDRSNIIIKQESYKSPRATKEVTNKTWIIPLSCAKKSQPDFSNTQPSIWLIDGKEITLPNEVKIDEWFICNLQQSGYYRVNYDWDNWNLIIEQLLSTPQNIHPLNRAQLIDDAYIFAIDELLPVSTLFDLWRYLKHEVDPIPWSTALNRIFAIVQQHDSTAVSAELRHFVKHLVENFYSYVGFYEKPIDSELTKILRSRLTFIACDLNVGDCGAKANMEFSKDDLSQIPAYVRETALCTGFRTNSTISAWNRLWDLYKVSNNQYDQENIIWAIGCARNETLLKKFLNILVDNKDYYIRRQHEIFVIRSVIRFPEGVLATINFVHDTLHQIDNNTKVPSVAIRLLQSIRGLVQSHDQIHRVNHLLEEAEKLDKEKYGDIKKLILSIKANAMKVMARNEKMAEKISAILKPSATTLAPPTPKPSAASSIVPRVITLSIIFISKWGHFLVY